MLELKHMYIKNFKSVFISKFCFKYSKSIFDSIGISYYLVIKKKKQNKINFFFIILVLMMGSLPNIIKAKNKSKKINNEEFLAFKYNVNFFDIQKLINFYLPITDIIENLYFKFNNYEYRMTIKYFPIVNEVDTLCVINSGLLEFIQNYKLILKFKTFKSNWYFNESLIRSLNIPLVGYNRFYL